MLKGIAPGVQTTNWDGLIEAALQKLALVPEKVPQGRSDPEDLREQNRRSESVKFHGCAVRARGDEDTYRPLLIARTVQISGWTTEHVVMKDHLQLVYSTMPALLVGLSAQDANIHTVFNQAIKNLRRNLAIVTTCSDVCQPAPGLSPQARPSGHLRRRLRTERHSHQGASLLGAYAKPALAGPGAVELLPTNFAGFCGRCPSSSG